VYPPGNQPSDGLAPGREDMLSTAALIYGAQGGLGIDLMHRIGKGQFDLRRVGIRGGAAPEIWNAILGVRRQRNSRDTHDRVLKVVHHNPSQRAAVVEQSSDDLQCLRWKALICLHKHHELPEPVDLPWDSQSEFSCQAIASIVFCLTSRDRAECRARVPCCSKSFAGTNFIPGWDAAAQIARRVGRIVLLALLHKRLTVVEPV
jgi:hypothetical protein